MIIKYIILTLLLLLPFGCVSAAVPGGGPARYVEIPPEPRWETSYSEELAAAVEESKAVADDDYENRDKYWKIVTSAILRDFVSAVKWGRELHKKLEYMMEIEDNERE